MAATTPERYVVASCHVERVNDDAVWAAFSALQESRPGGLAVAALLRPPDSATSEDPHTWVLRAREAAARGPLGHHTHWTSPTHARPSGEGGEEPGARVLREGEWLRTQGLRPTLFCGGGWYTDVGVAAACAELGYVDCTPRPTRPGYLAPDAAWAELTAPARVELDGATLLALPTTHSAGDGLRAALGRRLPPRVHVYFHDTDLVDARRRRIVVTALRLLGRRGAATDLDQIAADNRVLPTVPWEAIARPRL